MAGTQVKTRGVHDFAVGDVVQLTGKFLKSTGQTAGGEEPKKWKVLQVSTGDFPVITVDEVRSDLGYWTAEELEADPMLKYRRIAAANLKRVGMPSTRDVW